MMLMNEVAAKIEIQELESRYAWAIDEGKPSALSNIFAPDATLWSNRLGRTINGRDEILTWYREYLHDWDWRNQRHYLTNFHVNVDGDRAASRFCYLLTYEAEGTSRMGWGHYEDSLIRADDRWWIMEKRITTVGVIHLEAGWVGLAELQPSAGDWE